MKLLNSILPAEWIPWAALATSILAGCIIAWLAVTLVSLIRYLKDGKTIAAIRSNLTLVLYFFFPTLFFTAYSGYYADIYPQHTWIFSLSKIIFVIVSAWLLIRVVDVFEKVLLIQFGFESPNSISERKIYTRIKFIKRFIISLIGIVAFGMLLMSFPQGRQFGVGILTSAGIVSVIIGFAAQKSLGNLLASIQIAFTQPIKLDDTIVIDNETGQIEEINLTNVVVKLWDKRRLIVPITFFVEKSYQNWTRNDSELTSSIQLYLSYTTPVDNLREMFKNLVMSHPKWDGDAFDLKIVETHPQYMTVRATVTVANATDSAEVKSYMREHLIAWLRDHYPDSLQSF